MENAEFAHVNEWEFAENTETLKFVQFAWPNIFIFVKKRKPQVPKQIMRWKGSRDDDRFNSQIKQIEFDEIEAILQQTRSKRDYQITKSIQIKRQEKI